LRFRAASDYKYGKHHNNRKMASELVVFDIETGGLDHSTEKILSISASYKDRKFHSLVNPGKPIPKAASRINGIYDTDVEHSPGWGVVGPSFFKWVKEQAGPTPTLCSYNGARFDLPFIIKHNQTLPAGALPDFEKVYHVDAFEIAQKHVAKHECGNHRQASIYAWLFGEAPEGQHTSVGDVEALEKIVHTEFFEPHIAPHTRELYSISKFK
jgi:DNA polymerase-3 subunit epsilon